MPKHKTKQTVHIPQVVVVGAFVCLNDENTGRKSCRISRKLFFFCSKKE